MLKKHKHPAFDIQHSCCQKDIPHNVWLLIEYMLSDEAGLHSDQVST